MAFKPTPAHIPKFGEALTNIMARHAVLIAQAEVEKIAKRAASDMQMRLRAQAFKSFHDKPLAQSTLDKKESLGLSEDTMISTGTYVSKIALQPKTVTSLGRKQQFYVGFADTDLATNEFTGQPRANVFLKDVAKWNELGTETIPARPHWGPALEDLRKQVVQDRKRIKGLIIKDWRLKLGIRS